MSVRGTSAAGLPRAPSGPLHAVRFDRGNAVRTSPEGTLIKQVRQDDLDPGAAPRPAIFRTDVVEEDGSVGRPTAIAHSVHDGVRRDVVVADSPAIFQSGLSVLHVLHAGARHDRPLARERWPRWGAPKGRTWPLGGPRDAERWVGGQSGRQWVVRSELTEAMLKTRIQLGGGGAQGETPRGKLDEQISGVRVQVGSELVDADLRQVANLSLGHVGAQHALLLDDIDRR